MDFVSFARLTFLNFWPVDDKAPFWGPSSTIIASREAADAVPEQKEGGRSGAKPPEGVNKEKRMRSIRNFSKKRFSVWKIALYTSVLNSQWCKFVIVLFLLVQF